MKLLPVLFRFKTFRLQKFIVFFVLFLAIAGVFLSARLTRAQIPPPTIPCSQVDLPEFQSLRPYQVSPCNPNVQNAALFCGNDLTITDTITAYRNDARYCQRYSPTELECFFNIRRTLNLAIDIAGAELPIMGRTEDDVINSQNQNETRNDAEKVNEYVSWYLNGVNLPTEYGSLDTADPEDVTKLVDYSGPINKLLPERIKRDEIRDTIENLGNAPSNQHNQVVGCVNLLGQITPCYPQRAGVREIRISDFSSQNRQPPNEEDYPNDYLGFLNAYKAWRGQRCITLPLIGINICINDPTRPDYWGNLYYGIPLSSREDRKGAVEVVNPYIQPVSPGVAISNVNIVTTPADLFFSHMKEAQELADTLQNTYVPKGNPKSGPVRGISPSEYCDLTEIRTNPGDDLFAGEIGVNLGYNAEFSCGFEIEEPPDTPYSAWCDASGGICVPVNYSACQFTIGGRGCPRVGGVTYTCKRGCTFPNPNPSCTVQARVVLNTITKTPLVDDIWSRLVAGTSGVFKRIFPKVEPGAPVEGILDIPAATGVSYSLRPPIPGVSLTAGSPRNQRGSAAELYFPHIGGIQQYFLQCIQTALRPQGFGEVCPSGLPPETAPTTCPSVPDSSIPGRWLGGFKQNFISLANRWTSDCPGPDNNMADECYNYVVKESLDAGVNPAFSLTIWANESDASNYCHGGPTTQDFGINDASIYQNIIDQLDRFLVLPFSGTYTSCRNQPGWLEPMHAFLSNFRDGNCDPTSTVGTQYYNDIRTFTWPNAAPGCSWPSWPTDNTCP